MKEILQNQIHAFPSPLTQVKITTGQGDQIITMPRNELFRVKNIFNLHEYAVPQQFLPTDSLVAVDIGANVGLFSLYLKSVRPDSTIHCFEPAPPTLKLLNTNIGALPGIHIHGFGLGEKNEIVSMFLHPENTGENTIKGVPNDPDKCVDIKIVAAEEAFSQLGLGYIDLLKIDTEGCEVEVLRNLKERVGYIGIILVEYHSDIDRRIIDKCLLDFRIFDAHIASPEVGTLKYINRRLLTY